MQQHVYSLEHPSFSYLTPTIKVVHQRGKGIAYRIWPSAHVLVDYLCQNKDLLENSHIIEIGAGVGLVGTAIAAMLNHPEANSMVVLTDLEEALDALETTKSANSDFVQKHLSVTQLRFGNSSDLNEVVQKHQTGLLKRKLLMIGSDLVYFESLFEPLAKTMQDFVYNHGGQVILAYKKRIYKNEKRFFTKILKQHGLKFEVLFEATVEEEDGVSQKTDGRVVQSDETAEGGWNSRIFKIIKDPESKVSSSPVVSRDAPESEAYEYEEESYQKNHKKSPSVTTTPQAAATEPQKKSKKGKVPVSKEKKGRIR
jgi:predicted nicotinamide N-methyase